MTQEVLGARMVLSHQFMPSFEAIPNTEKRAVRERMEELRRAPEGSYWVYERVQNAPDARMRLVRLTQKWHAVVLRPDKARQSGHQEVYVLLWLAHRDEAERWALEHRCEIHPITGSVQVFQAAPTLPAPTIEEPHKPKLLEAHGAEVLEGFGVPSVMMPLVQQLVSLEHLEALRPQLPQEAYEALRELGEGRTVEQVRLSQGLNRPPLRVDTEDYAAALSNPATQQRFAEVEDERTLSEILDAPLEQWRVFLHPSQRRLSDHHWSGPVRVLGGAGTGKTVVAMHRARYLAQKVFVQPHQQVLFVTFTTNLATDIRNNLQRLCGPELSRKIVVTSLDRWVQDLLKRHGYGRTVRYFGAGPKELLDELWERAMEKYPASIEEPDEFAREEWEEVVQTWGCVELRDYLTVERKGRGVRLSREQRKALWPVFEAYRALMYDHKVCESADALRDARHLLQRSPELLPFESVIVDETQDMSLEALRLLRQVVPKREGGRANDLFLVGDGHQKIYRNRVALSKAGIEIVGRSSRLKINYRTTEGIRAYAVALLEGQAVDDLDGGQDTLEGYRSLRLGPPPEVKKCASFERELDEIVLALGADPSQHKKTCLVARTQDLLDRYKDALKRRGLSLYELKRGEAEDRSADGVRVATMHRVKGLEFERVIAAGINEGVVPLLYALEQAHDPQAREEAMLRERALLYVALTRAKEGALITSHGAASPWI